MTNNFISWMQGEKIKEKFNQLAYKNYMSQLRKISKDFFKSDEIDYSTFCKMQSTGWEPILII